MMPLQCAPAVNGLKNDGNYKTWVVAENVAGAVNGRKMMVITRHLNVLDILCWL